jgi:predicted glycosyltransferase involved in capsule biosynthesis
MVTGACLMIRRTIFERLDGFDESFVNGHEDMDLCLRVRQMGYKVMYCPESVITHFEARTKRLIGLDNFHYKKGVNNEEGRGRRRFLEKWQDVLEIDDQNYYIEDGVVKQARVTPKSYTKSGDSFNILFTMYGWSET